MTRIRTIAALVLMVSWVHSQDLKIVHMEGTFDLDEDGLLEFISIEGNPILGQLASMIRYYEIDEEGFQRLTWELEVPNGLLGSFVGVKIGDIDGNGTPELVTVMNISDPEDEGILQPVIFIYPWTGGGFSEEPAQSFNMASRSRFLRCYNFDLMDQDGDGDQEIAASLGSPVRGFTLVDMDDAGELQLVQRLYPEGLRYGTGFVYVVVVDYDRDGYDDLIGFTPEGNVLKVQAYANIEGTFEAQEPVTRVIEGLNGLLTFPITETDWDSDGFRDILLPFQTGDLIGLTLTPVTVVIDELPVDAGPLSSIQVADFDQDGFDDILLISGEMNLMTLAYGAQGGLQEPADYFTLESEEEVTQVFTALPLTRLGLYSGSVIAASWDGFQSSVFITDMGLRPESEISEPAFPEEVLSLTLEEQTDLLDNFPEISPLPFEMPKVPKPLVTMGQPLPADILPRHVLPVNQPFAYTLPEDDTWQFYSFRWLQPPPQGMFFHYETRSIQWIPDETQLGAYPLAYHIEIKVGETVDQEVEETDSLETYRVVPILEGYDEQLWIYVNDPPVFITEPTGVEFVAGSEFVYNPLVRDRNENVTIRFDLEVAPEGMEVRGGIIRWQTDSTHVDVYDVRIVATDGFDRAAQEFKLFARAGVKILSEAETEARVNELYTYKPEVWKQNLEHKLDFSLVSAPEGMSIDEQGLVRWTPTATQVDTQSYTILVTHGVVADSEAVHVFVNHPPVVESAPPPMNKINVGSTWDFQIQVSDPNRDDRLIFTALKLPVGMRMDPFTGRLRWDPMQEDVDFAHLAIEVSDGRESRLIEAEFFVNAPIQIVSIPPMLAEVGEPYKYKIMTTDLNRGSLLPYGRVVRVDNVEAVKIYSVQVSDDVYRENIDRYIGDWDNADAVYITDPENPEDSLASRLNVKRYVQTIFYEDERLVVILQTLDGRTIKIKDVLWEFFQGSKGKPPRVVVERHPVERYTLTEFPDGAVVDEMSGTIQWTPSKEQVDTQTFRVIVSDGYAKDEQAFEVYVNHPPTIVSTAPTMGLVGEVYKYQVQVEDKNSDVVLKYTLIKGPQGMQMSRSGRIAWIPKAAQINTNTFQVKVADGYGEDVQNNKVFVNIPPAVISTPKPVALTGYEYRYRMAAQDLNQDKITYRSVKIPKYSRFNRKTGMLQWKPKASQRGPNDVIIMAIDEHGATTAHEFQIHVFEDPSARQFVNTGWPLMLTFVGVMFAWGMAQI